METFSNRLARLGRNLQEFNANDWQAVSGLTATCCRQAQSFRTMRRDIMAVTEDAIKEEEIFMSTRRVMAAKLSLLCVVVNSICPVCKAFMAISAVAQSRISPTMMMFGSCGGGLALY
jgi:hypothetical protein